MRVESRGGRAEPIFDTRLPASRAALYSRDHPREDCA
jgi:hypothetical protein